MLQIKSFSFRPINGGTNIYDMMQIFFKRFVKYGLYLWFNSQGL